MTSVSNFGALTTTFSAPTDCSVEKWVQHNSNATSLRWGVECTSNTIAYASSCYPPGWSGANNNTALAYKGFSPGLACPYGWRPVTSASSIHRDQGWNPLNSYITSIADDEIATLCCPSGYVLKEVLCYSQTINITESLPLITTSNGKCHTQTVGPFTGKIGGTSASKGAAIFQAYPVILVNTDSSTGLSTGAKIGIGIGIPAGVLVLAAIVFIWWHRRRRARARASEVVPPAVGEPYTGKPELDTGQEVGPSAPAELPTVQTYAQAELPARKSADTPQAELPGDFGQLYSAQEDIKEDSRERTSR
ncbi:hypothetical protein N7448_008464 [Penicillium atrosanguineum]|nr:hypothetical protein N7448_008464 [Penicillium atrosanguineum]